jgi:hypothetical protein
MTNQFPFSQVSGPYAAGQGALGLVLEVRIHRPRADKDGMRLAFRSRL